MPAWPASLPQEPEPGKWKERQVTKPLRSDVQAGYAQVRSAYTGDVWAYDVSYQLTLAQVQTLKSFVRTDLGQGVSYFDWPHPGNRTETVSVRFQGDLPGYEHQGADVYLTKFTLETAPRTTPPGIA